VCQRPYNSPLFRGRSCRVSALTDSIVFVLTRELLAKALPFADDRHLERITLHNFICLSRKVPALDHPKLEPNLVDRVLVRMAQMCVLRPGQELLMRLERGRLGAFVLNPSDFVSVPGTKAAEPAHRGKSDVIIVMKGLVEVLGTVVIDTVEALEAEEARDRLLMDYRRAALAGARLEGLVDGYNTMSSMTTDRRREYKGVIRKPTSPGLSTSDVVLFGLTPGCVFGHDELLVGQDRFWRQLLQTATAGIRLKIELHDLKLRARALTQLEASSTTIKLPPIYRDRVCGQRKEKRRALLTKQRGDPEPALLPCTDVMLIHVSVVPPPPPLIPPFSAQGHEDSHRL
jgi:hypothetical protein